MSLLHVFFSLPPSAAHTQSTFRRQVFRIQPSDVIITNITNNAQGVLEFVMYIQVAGGARVLRVEVLESAVQVTMFFSFRILLLLVLVGCTSG